MLTFTGLKQKEISEELKLVINVFDDKIKEEEIKRRRLGLDEQENSSIANRFLLAERDSAPFYINITSNKLTNANDERINFFDVEEVMKLTPRGVENRIEEKKSIFSLEGVKNVVSSMVNLSKIKELFKVDQSDGMSLLSKEEVTRREIKKIAVSMTGNNLALVTRQNLILVFRMEGEGKLFNPRQSYLDESILSDNEIVDICWHGADNNELLVAYSNKLVVMQVTRELDLLAVNQVKSSNITSVKWSPDGEYILVLSNKGKTINLYYKDLSHHFSESLTLDTYRNIIWAPNSSLFITFTESEICLYNSRTWSYKSWTEFKHPVVDVAFSACSNYIFIFTDTDECLMYVIYNEVEDFSRSNEYSSYNNPNQDNLHNEYKLHFKIFHFKYADNMCICKARINTSNNRLVILYKDSLSDKTELKSFSISLNDKVHNLAVISIFSVKTFRGMKLTDFELYYNYLTRSDLLLSLWSDRILSLTYLNAYDIKFTN